MKKNNIRNMAFCLVISQMLSMAAHASANSNDHLFYYLDRNNKMRVTDDKSFIINDGKTYVENGDTISIYDDRNNSSKQYGASQASFDVDSDLLIKDPYVLNMMRSVFRPSMYISNEFAKRVYIKFFKELSNQGCGYIVFANYIYQLYENNPEEFEKVFGFPMYVIKEDKTIDFNYEYFYLGHFLYFITSNYNSKKIEEVAHVFDKDVARELLEEYKNSEKYKKSKAVDWKELKELRREGKITEEELMASINNYQEADNYEAMLQDIINNSKDYKVDFGLSEDNNLGNFKAYLESFGLSVSINIKNLSTRPGAPKYTDYQPGDIIVYEGLVLYKHDPVTGEDYSQVKYLSLNEFMQKYGPARKYEYRGHSINITEIENGKVYTSSMGEKFIVDVDKSIPSIVIRLKVQNKNYTKTR